MKSGLKITVAIGYDKTLSLSGAKPPNRVVIVEFANMDAVKAPPARYLPPWSVMSFLVALRKFSSKPSLSLTATSATT